MRRRHFLILASAAFALRTSAAFAAADPPRIGWLWSGRSTPTPNEVKGFQQGLRDLGYVEGQTVLVEYRFGEGSNDHLDERAAELVAFHPDVLVAINPFCVHALQKTRTTIPIVALTGNLVDDDIGVASLARPGGRVTGISAIPVGITAKRMDLLRQALPAIRHVGFLYNAHDEGGLREAQQAAATLGLVLHAASVPRIEDLRGAIDQLKQAGVEGVLVDSAPPMILYQPETVAAALEQHLATVSEQPEAAQAGALITYGPSVLSMAQRQAYFADKIIKGANPGDLPVEYPIKYDFLINSTTAKTLGIHLSPSLLGQADDVIE
jgi:putative ABC transport system substrate-binding protein